MRHCERHVAENEGGAMARYPRQVDGLELKPVEDGAVIYDRDGDRVHYLNPTAALVLELCDGASDAAEIARLLQAHFGLEAPPRAEVESLIAQLLDESLVEYREPK
jgi:PqqD family protein of HPr-rel-A system